MINIKHESREFTKVEKYMLTSNPEIKKISDLEDGTVLHVNGFMIFDDEKDDGDTVEVLTLNTSEGVYSTNSDTFKRSLDDIETVMESDVFPIKKISGKTKSDRTYVNCTLAVEEITVSESTD